MIRSWLKITWRHWRAGRLYTMLNAAGLTAGVAASLLIGLWIYNEVAFNTVHRNIDRIAQVMDNQPADGATNTGELLPIPLAAELRSRFGGDLTGVALYFPNFTHILTVEDPVPASVPRSIARAGSWVQPDLPLMLTLTMLEGRADALKDPSSVLITHGLAQALFGQADPMGRSIRVDNTIVVKVGGVFDDLPSNSTFSDVQIFLSWDKAVEEMAWMKNYQSAWNGYGWKIFVQLGEHADIDRINHHIKGLMAPHSHIAGETLMLHPMRRWHLYGEFANGASIGGRIRIVRLFTGIGIFILLLACINFMNLSTARSERRAREIGILKVIGSLRYQLIVRFLGEALMMTVTAVVLALVLVQLTLPFFNDLSGKQLSMPWSEPAFGAWVLGFILITSLLAGSYPAFYLSRFRAVQVLKGDLRSGPWSVLPRKVMVVVQFTLSISLIIATLFVNRQVRFAKDRSVGYTRAGLLTIGKNSRDLYEARHDALRDDLLRTGAVLDMAQSSTPATEDPGADNSVTWSGKDAGTKPSFNTVGITAEYGNTLGWRIIVGRDFDRRLATDSQKVIVNESAARLMGFKQPIGQNIRVWGQTRVIIGVVKDIVMASPFQRVPPGVFTLITTGQGNAITIRVRPVMPMGIALTTIENVFKKYNPASPFVYHFVDTEYALKFAEEERIGGLASAFTLFAIGISCLGLFGLAAHSGEQRTREIGIRKVLGSSVINIWQLLTREVVSLIGLSCALAIPLSALFLHRWLQQYEYRAPLSAWVFCAASGGAFFIALCTISFHAFKAARSNPIKSLRSQ